MLHCNTDVLPTLNRHGADWAGRRVSLIQIKVALRQNWKFVSRCHPWEGSVLLFRVLLAVHALCGSAMAAIFVVSAYALGMATLFQLCVAAAFGVVLILPISVLVAREVTEDLAERAARPLRIRL